MRHRSLRFRGPRAAIAAAVLVAAATGCHTIELTPAVRRSIQTVSIEREVRVPERIEYSGRELEGHEVISPTLLQIPILRELCLLYAITPIGIWQTSRAYSRMEAELTERFRDVDIGGIVRDRMATVLERSGLFPSIVRDGADARLFLTITGYGLSTASWGFGEGARPWVEVEGVLVDPEGVILWRRRETVSTGEDRIIAHDIEKLRVNPELFQRAFGRAASIVAVELVRHMAGGPVY